MTSFDKHWRPAGAETIPNRLADRTEELKIALRSGDPAQIARLAGVSYLPSGSDSGEFHIPLIRESCTLSWPGLSGYDGRKNPLLDFKLTLLLYYLFTADGTPLAGNWVSFAELPGGRMYNTAFQGYSGDQLAKSFESNLDDFREACASMGGKELEIGSCSFLFDPLPRLPMMVTYWLGDEDFPSSCKILFDESACHYLPIDVCAILGGMLARKLIKSRATNSYNSSQK